MWDQQIFNFNTTLKRRGIWIIIAPALMIIMLKQ